MTVLNGNQGQLMAKDQEGQKFKAGQELYSLITSYVNPQYGMDSVCRIGIQAPIGTHVQLNGVDFEIGKTGILEARDLAITSIVFPEDTDSSVIIDFIVNTLV